MRCIIKEIDLNANKKKKIIKQNFKKRNKKRSCWMNIKVIIINCETKYSAIPNFYKKKLI